MLALLVLVPHAYAAARRGAWRPWLVATAAGLVPVLPFVYLGLRQKGTQLEWIPPMTPGVVAAAPGAIFGSAAAGLLLIGLAFAVRWPDRPLVRELALLAALPPILLIAVSFVSSNMWVPRYVLVVVVPVALLAAATLGGLRLRAVAVLVALALVAAPAQRQIRGPASHMGADFRAVAGIIAAGQRPGDVIVYGTGGTWSLRAGIDYQLRGKPKPRDVLLARPAADVGTLNAVQCADRVACLGAAKRVWFFRQWQTGPPLTDAGPLTTTLRTGYRQAGVWHATKATLVLFERR
jgi:mannosyltransferase